MKNKIKGMSKSLMFIIFCAAIALIGILADFGEFQPPQSLLNKTESNNIYQTLVQVQATLAGLVLVVVSLLTSITKDKIYGMSVAKYIMNIKPAFPFRHIDTILVEIILIFLSWICVALGLYNTAIAVFAIALFLIMLLICSVINVMQSSFEQEKEIYEYILESEKIEHTENLLKEINYSIALGDIAVFERDCIFAKKLIEKKFEKWSKNGDDVNSFQRFFSTIILTAIRHNFSRSVDVLDLYILLLEQANKQVDGIFLIDKISYRDILDLLAIIPVKNVLEGNIMYRFQENHFINYSVQAEKMTGTTEDIVNYSAFKSTLSPRIFYYAGKECRAEEDETDELGKRIIENLQRLLEECKKLKNYIAKSFPETYEKNCQRYSAISRYEEYFENDYLTFIITLIKTNNQILLNILFGRGSRGALLTPINKNFHEERVNAFVFMFMYCASNNAQDRISGELKDYMEKALKEMSSNFWNDISFYLIRISDDNFFAKIGELFKWFFEKHDNYQFLPNVSYGIGAGFNYDESATYKFFCFIFAHLNVSAETLEKYINAIMIKEKGYTANYLLTHCMSENTLDSYKDFCTLMDGEKSTKAEYNIKINEEYETLKSVLTTFYCRDELKNAADISQKYDEEQNEREKRFTNFFTKLINDFTSEFAQYNEDDEADYKKYCLSWNHTLSERSMEGELDGIHVNWFSEHIKICLYGYLVDKIHDKLHINNVKESNSVATVEMFFSQFTGLEPCLLLGFHRFWDDPDWARYDELSSKCKRPVKQFGGLHLAINSHLIKVDIRNISVNVNRLSDDAIQSEIGSIDIPLNEQQSNDYLFNKKRIIEIKMEIAVSCDGDFVGGGFSYK